MIDHDACGTGHANITWAGTCHLEMVMPERNERTLFDMLAMVLRGFSVLTWITLGITGYVWFSDALAQGVIFTVWGEMLGIVIVFIMSLAVWWYAGFVARKGRERQGTLRHEDD